MIETTPPKDDLHRRLWLMGFDRAQRNVIIDVAGKINASPADLALFCMSSRSAKDIANLGIVVDPMPWYIELWSWARYAWHWVTSWQFELRRKRD